MADDITHYDAIEGYFESASYVAGEPAQLCVSTTADRFDVEVHRWGARRELVWSASAVAGRLQPTPPDADAAGCGWEPDVEIATGSWFVVGSESGDVFTDEPDGLWRRVLRRQPVPLRWVAWFPPDPSLN